MRLFGFQIKRADDDTEKQLESFAEPLNDDGALNVGATGGSYGVMLDIEGTAKTEAELVTKYRQMTLNPEIQQAVDEIVNEAVCISTDNNVVEIVLDDVKISDKVKKMMTEEFTNILQLLDFSNKAYDIMTKFYVDGRLNYHIIIDEKNSKEGIRELRYLDPRKIRMIREMENIPIQQQGSSAVIKKVKNEYYMYSETGFGTAIGGASSFSNTTIGGLKIAKDSIARATSGILNESNTVVLSYLHRAMKSLNQLRMLEDATVIYTITRAPDRRIFYIDVGNLPKVKAEQYLQDMMARHKSKVTYDSASGEIADGRKMMTMTEDYYFPRRGGDRSTEVETLPGSGGLGEERNLPYFQNKLYKALNVPVGRLQPETLYSMGRSSEITREELKFAKFVARIRGSFSVLFDKCLERQLVLKEIITPDEWVDIKNKIRYDFMKDNYFEELKETEILREKLNTLQEVDPYIGKFFSLEWVRRKVLFMSDDETKEIKKQMEAEKKSGEFIDPNAQQQVDPGTADMQPDDQGMEQQPPQQVADESLSIINKKNKFPQRG